METEKLLLHLSQNGSATCLEASGDLGQEILEEAGNDIQSWPSDLGIYDKEQGFWIWDGTISRDLEDLDGTIRPLNPSEWDTLKRLNKVFE